MFQKKQCIAMLLAGGQGSRLGVLTKHTAKPAVPFGGKYRIIDFPLSNCSNSGIEVVGVLTMYRPLELNAYIGSGTTWDLDLNNGGVFVLPPYSTGSDGRWYQGTANAIYQNIEFVEQYKPDYVLVLSGDHIYKMDYSKMLNAHIKNNAAATIAVLNVPWEDTSRFGIMNTDANSFITEFEEKPKHAKSNKASMGVYIFNWNTLKKYLIEDEKDSASSNDFGKNIIPNMLHAGERLLAYSFNGYWKDVGNIQSLWEANMDLIQDPPNVDLHDENWRIYARNVGLPPEFIGKKANVTNCMISEGAKINGEASNCIISGNVRIEEGAKVSDSVVMPGALIQAGVVIKRAIIGENTIICSNAQVGEENGAITVVGHNTTIESGVVIHAGEQVGE